MMRHSAPQRPVCGAASGTHAVPYVLFRMSFPGAERTRDEYPGSLIKVPGLPGILYCIARTRGTRVVRGLFRWRNPGEESSASAGAHEESACGSAALL
jgi:hypothetical protein